MSDRYTALCIVVAILVGGAVMIAEDFRPHSPEELRVMAFKKCMNTMGASEATCKEVVGEAQSNNR